jgi:ribulose bisphosphate carboxylase small subunit
MRSIDEISFQEFKDAMNWLNVYATKSKKEYVRYLFDIKGKYRLADELIYYLSKSKNRLTPKHKSMMMQYFKATIAIWILLNEPDKTRDTIH